MLTPVKKTGTPPIVRTEMYARKTTPRIAYRLQQNQRISDSISLAAKFPRLKALSVDLNYFDSSGLTRHSGLKYRLNLEHAKSVFFFNCPNGECVGGDFDLSEALAQAVASKRKLVTGEMRCQGMRHTKEHADGYPCQNLLQYKLSLGY
jgi:hypothetical protein